MKSPWFVRAVASVAALSTSACAGTLAPAFDQRFADSSTAQIAAIGKSLPEPATAPPTDAMLCATTPEPNPELVAYDLEHKRVRWRVALRAESRPELLGDLVITTAGGHLLGFDRASGKARVDVALGACAYRGAARAGERLFFSCERAPASTGAPQQGRIVGVDVRSSRVLFAREAAGELGRPAAVADFVFVPWQWQNLSVLDARNGRELARLRSRDDVIEWARADARGVFFGQRRVYRLGRLGYGGAREAASFLSVDSRALPGRPNVFPSAFQPQPATRGAYGRIALYLEPEARGADAIAIAHDHYDFGFYRYVFGYAATGELRWARMLSHDAIAGAVLPEGVAIATEDGGVQVLSQADGTTLFEARLGAQWTSASLSAAGLTLAAPAAPATHGGSLRRALTEIALDTDNRLVPARAYAVEQLARLDEPEVTRDLLDVYAASSSPPEVQRAVADALRARKTGLEHLIDALAAHYDFLEQSRPAPLAVIVPPLIEAHETRAVPRLVERMRDPETPLAVLPLVVRGVSELGDDTVLEPLLAFLRLYRDDSSFAGQPEALLEAMRGVLAHGHERAPALLAGLGADGRLSAALAEGLAALAKPPNAEAGGAQPGAAAAATPVTREPALPAGLSQDAVRAMFAEHIDELRTCIIDELGRNPKLAQLRIAFIAESDGSTHALSFVPNTPALVDCLYPKVAAYRFPRFASGRELASYVIAVRAGESEPLRPLEEANGDEFWLWYARHPRPERTRAGLTPWWQSQQPVFGGIAVNAEKTTPKTNEGQGQGQNEDRSPASPAPGAASKEDAWWVPKVAPPAH